MFHIRHKAVGAQKIPDQRIGRGHRALDDGSTRQTNQVKVVSVIAEVVRRRTVVKMCVGDHPDLLECLEVAIDGGQGQDGPAVSGKRRRDPVRCCVTQAPDRIDDSLPLPGQPHALGPQPLAKVLHSIRDYPQRGPPAIDSDRSVVKSKKGAR